MKSYLKTLPKTEEQLHNLTIRKYDKFTVEHRQKLSNAKKNKKKVAQYDLEENLLNTFNSIEAAAASIDSTEATQKTKANRISECCNEKRKTIYGSIWKFI